MTMAEAGSAGAEYRPMAASMSARTMRPPGPVPVMPVRSSLCSRANVRTSGVALTGAADGDARRGAAGGDAGGGAAVKWPRPVVQPAAHSASATVDILPLPSYQ